MTTIATRGRRRETSVAVITTWPTRCGRWAVKRTKNLYLRRVRYIVVERLANGNERIVSGGKRGHRSRRAAERALCRLAERGSSK